VLFRSELKDFTVFIQSTWGILAGISVFFPLSNVLAGVIPLKPFGEEGGELVYLSPPLVTALTTVITLFMLFWMFGQRRGFKTKKKQSQIRRQALLSFIVGFAALICYFVITFSIYTLWYAPWGINSDNPARLVGDVLMLVTYSSFFMLVTRAFTLLGMIEYFGKTAK
jgi:membrane protease YdiL (CAAX protease family)